VIATRGRAVRLNFLLGRYFAAYPVPISKLNKIFNGVTVHAIGTS